MNTLLSYIGGLFTLLILDAVMITFVILPLFKKYIPDFLRADPNFLSAGLFYLLYIGVLLFLVILPAHASDTPWQKVVLMSLLFGFGAYMTYELTSLSVMKGWSWNMVLIDTLWGTILTGIIGFIMYSIIHR